jgi:PEP-CTERM motif
MFRLSRFGWLLLAAVAAWGLAPPQDCRAQTYNDISSGTFSMGINSTYGEMYDYSNGLGFRRLSDGYDPIAPGSPREAWGVSAGSTAGYADQADFGTTNLSTGSGLVVTPSSLSITNNLTTLPSGGSNLLQVSQNYSFVAANIVQIAVSITNVSGVSQLVNYARNVDWDVAPTEFNEITKVSPLGSLPLVTAASYYGFENPSPLAPFSSSTTGGTYGPADLGAGFQVNLGTLAAGATTSFDLWYGLNTSAYTGTSGQSPAGLVSQLLALEPGISTYAVGYSSDGDINTATNSIILGVGMPAVTAVPEPSTFAIAGIGGLAFMGYAWRRRRHGS